MTRWSCSHVDFNVFTCSVFSLTWWCHYQHRKRQSMKMTWESMNLSQMILDRKASTYLNCMVFNVHCDVNYFKDGTKMICCFVVCRSSTTKIQRAQSQQWYGRQNLIHNYRHAVCFHRTQGYLCNKAFVF